MVLGKLERYVQKMKLDHFLTLYTKMNSQWIKDLNIRPATIQILEENIGSKILDISYSNMFSDISAWARGTKEKIIQWDYITLKSFCTA